LVVDRPANLAGVLGRLDLALFGIYRLMKIMNLLMNSNRMDRIVSLFEIRINQLFFDKKPDVAMSFKEALSLIPVEVSAIIRSGEAEDAVLYARDLFADYSRKAGEPLPYPVVFNADKSLASLIYAFSRSWKPALVLEAGVGYGISSTLVLLAMERNGHGVLSSIDLPSLADPRGRFTGVVVPKHNGRWFLQKGGSRQLLRASLAEVGSVDLFISDSANVFTLQKYEFESVLPFLSPKGGMIFNNISLKFQEYLGTLSQVDVYTIWQEEKQECVTALVLKK
jgi:hypothetical protein